MPITHNSHQQAVGGAELRGWEYRKFADVTAMNLVTGRPGEICTVTATGDNYVWNATDAAWRRMVQASHTYPFLRTFGGGINASITADVTSGRLAVGDAIAWASYYNGQHLGAGVGRIVAGATGTADNGTYLNAGTLQVQQIFSDTISVCQFGALPGFEQTAAVQNALTRAAQLNLPLIFPEGVFLMTGALVVPFLGATIIGAGMDKTILRATGGGTSFNMIQIGGGSPTDIRHLTVDGNAAAMVEPAADFDGTGVFATSGDSIHHWYEVEARNCNGYGFLAQRGASTSLTVDAINCRASGNDVHGFRLLNATSSTISGGHFTGNGQYGLLVDSCSDVTIKGNEADGNTASGIVVVYSERFTVSDNVTSGNGQDGIALGGGTIGNTANRYWTVSGNVCASNTGHGITIDPTTVTGTTHPQMGTITGNTSRGNTQHGIYIQHSEEIVVAGNISTDNGLSGLQVSLVVNGSVVGNVFARNAVNGINVSKSNIVTDPGSNVRIGFNAFDANTNGPLITEAEYPGVDYDFPKSGVTANRPLAPVVGMSWFDTTLNAPVWWTGTAWVTAAAGSTPVNVTVTGDGATTVFTVTHNLALTTPFLPAGITVLDPGGNILSGSSYQLSNALTNSFTVTFAVAPANAAVHTFRVTA